MPAAVRPAGEEWLEPQGISIVDLVGQVPDSYLGGAIIAYTPGFGIVRYDSGSRSGAIVTLNTTIYPRYIIAGGWHGSLLSCLGQPARIDQIGVSVPAATVRFFDGGREVTREVDAYTYIPSSKIKPIRNPQQSETQNEYRYPESQMTASTFTADGQLKVPANMGCELTLSFKNYRELTAVWTVTATSPVRVQALKTENVTFHSYIGVGNAGMFGSLLNQLYQAGYRDRVESIAIIPPAGADYFFFNYQPSLGDPYTQFQGNPYGNIDRPTSGSYRVRIQPGLSVDHVVSMALPLFGHWQDIDQCKGTFLAYSSQPLGLNMPEYLLPPGIPYNSCMVYGGCARELLDSIYAATGTGKLIYLRVDRTSADLQRIPLRMAGVSYAASGDATGNVASLEDVQNEPLAGRNCTYLPALLQPTAELPRDDTDGCSALGGCGWFTPDGRMVDYIPAP